MFFLPLFAFCFGSLEENVESVNGSKRIVHSRNGTTVSRMFLNPEGHAVFQRLYFEGKEVFVIANDPDVNNVYHKMIGFEGIDIMEYEVDSRKKISIGNPIEGKIEVFEFRKDGFVEPISDEELSHLGYLPLSGNCIVLPDEK